MLHAVYTARELAGSDVENVLIYNVGPGCFGDLSRNGLYLERKVAAPPEPPMPLCSKCTHHHRYRVVARQPASEDLPEGTSLASWSDIVVPPVHADTKVALVWRAVKRQLASVNVSALRAGESPYGLRIAVNTPGPLNLAATVKPLVDGIVCALHYHEGRDETEKRSVVAGLARELHEDPEAVAQMLTDTERAVLGPRRLLWPRGSGVQWNPDDGKCVLIAMTASLSPGSVWRVSGDVYTVTPTPQSFW